MRHNWVCLPQPVAGAAGCTAVVASAAVHASSAASPGPPNRRQRCDDGEDARGADRVLAKARLGLGVGQRQSAVSVSVAPPLVATTNSGDGSRCQTQWRWASKPMTMGMNSSETHRSPDHHCKKMQSIKISIKVFIIAPWWRALLRCRRSITIFDGIVAMRAIRQALRQYRRK